MYVKAPVPEPAKPDDDLIISDFFPPISLSHLRQAMRLDGTVTNERLRHAINNAVSLVNHNLRTWAQAQLDPQTGQPIIALNGVQAQTYQRAVYAYTAANIAERMTNFDATIEGRARAEEQNAYAHQLMRDGHWAIRDLKGEPRTTVELC